VKPYLLMDVDGVLNPNGPAKGFRVVGYDGPGSLGGCVRINDSHIPWLAGLLPHVEFVWCTSWSTSPEALRWLAGQLRLPEDLPCIDVGRGGVAWGYTLKYGPVREFIGDRPAVWIDDVFGGKEWGWSEDRTAAGIPTLIEEVDPWRGLDDIGMGRVLAWLKEQEIGLDGDTYEPERESG
jgi:hypothetical protein